MKVVIAVDSFKGTLGASEACEIIRSEFVKAKSSIEAVCRPLADGGEGTAAIVQAAIPSRWVECRVAGPLPEKQVMARFLWIEQTRTALVEMAIANGITLLEKKELNPLKTSTYGTGQLIAEAVKLGAEHIYLAVGGSATVDCGIGAAAAIGFKFLDENGEAVPLGGEGMSAVRSIVKPADLKLPKVSVLCDVSNPLTGKSGAAHVFGPQKGATPEMVEMLDAGLKNIAAIVRSTFGIDMDVAGAGAAGGLAGGAIGFFNAQLAAGIEAVMDIVKFDEALDGAGWVITGEGCFDSQSLNGKVVSGVLKRARAAGVKVGVIAGDCRLEESVWRGAGVEAVATCRKPGMDKEYAIANARKCLEECSREFAEKNLVVSFGF